MSKKNCLGLIRRFLLYPSHIHFLEITFFWGSNQQCSAVLALEFIKIGTDLYFIFGSLEQAGEDGAAFGGGVDVLEEPARPAGSVEETVALNVLRLAVNLKNKK